MLVDFDGAGNMYGLVSLGCQVPPISSIGGPSHSTVKVRMLKCEHVCYLRCKDAAEKCIVHGRGVVLLVRPYAGIAR